MTNAFFAGLALATSFLCRCDNDPGDTAGSGGADGSSTVASTMVTSSVSGVTSSGGGAPVQCLSSDDEDAIQGGDCHRIRGNCTDGHTYAFECAAGTCRCKVDGAQTSTPAATKCPLDAAGMSALCGWNISM